MSDPQIVRHRRPAIGLGDKGMPHDHIRATINVLAFGALFSKLRRLNASPENER